MNFEKIFETIKWKEREEEIEEKLQKILKLKAQHDFTMLQLEKAEEGSPEWNVNERREERLFNELLDLGYSFRDTTPEEIKATLEDDFVGKLAKEYGKDINPNDFI